jgi:hypothetical protein
MKVDRGRLRVAGGPTGGGTSQREDRATIATYDEERRDVVNDVVVTKRGVVH